MTDINQAIMHAKEPVDGREGSAYAIIDGRRFLLFQLKNFEAKDDYDMVEIPRLGTKRTGYREGIIKGTWTATLYYNTDVFRDLMYKYRKLGKMTYFDIQVTNDDPNSSAGRHTTIYKDCLLNGGIWAKLDIENTAMDEQVSGTFEDIEMPERFAILDGME